MGSLIIVASHHNSQTMSKYFSGAKMIVHFLESLSKLEIKFTSYVSALELLCHKNYDRNSSELSAWKSYVKESHRFVILILFYCLFLPKIMISVK